MLDATPKALEVLPIEHSGLHTDASAKDTFETFFSYKNYSTPDGEPVHVHLCESLQEVETALQYLVREPVLGFGIESKPYDNSKTKTVKAGEKVGLDPASPEMNNPTKTSDIDDKSRPPLVPTNCPCHFPKSTTPWDDLDEEIDLDRVRCDILGLCIHRNSPRALVESSNSVDGCQIVYKNGKPTGQNDSEGNFTRFTTRTKEKVSVIQLASPSQIIVAHIAAFPTTGDLVDLSQLVAPTLKSILENPTIIKVGVAIASDGADCAQYLEICPAGLIDLREIDKIVDGSAKSAAQQIGLEKLCTHDLGAGIKGKSPKKAEGEFTQTSDWSLSGLSDEQIQYAANDAFLDCVLYKKLNLARLAMSPIPELPTPQSIPPWSYQGPNTKTKKTTPPPPAPVSKYKDCASKRGVRTSERREKMSLSDRRLAEALSAVRDQIVEAKYPDWDGVKATWKIVEDKTLDKIIEAAPMTKKAMVAVIGNKKHRERFAPFAVEFWDVMINFQKEDFDSSVEEEKRTEGRNVADENLFQDLSDAESIVMFDMI